MCLPGTIAAQKGPVRETVLVDTVDVKIFFPVGTSYVDEAYRDNGYRLDRFAERVERIRRETGLELAEVSIVACVSPEGREEVNERTTQERALSLLRHLRRLTGMKQTRFLMDFRGIDWSRLTAIVEFSEMPYREEVLEILREARMPLYGEGADDECISRLKSLRRGVPYAYMQEHFFPVLRNAGQQVVCRFEQTGDVEPEEVTAEVVEVEYGTKATRETAATQEESAMQEAVIPVDEETDISPTPYYIYESRPLLALKTNLLFDALLMPNVEAEVPLGDRWSVLGEWAFPWWRKKDDSSTLQYLNGGVEGRYWLRLWKQPSDASHPLRGHFLGLFGGGGKYDIGHHSEGYQGTFWMAGISYGYSLPLNRVLNMEFSLGAGFLSTRYKHYKVEDALKIHQLGEKERYRWLGPLKAKVSLVWMLDRRVKVIQSSSSATLPANR